MFTHYTSLFVAFVNNYCLCCFRCYAQFKISQPSWPSLMTSSTLDFSDLTAENFLLKTADIIVILFLLIILMSGHLYLSIMVTLHVIIPLPYYLIQQWKTSNTGLPLVISPRICQSEMMQCKILFFHSKHTHSSLSQNPLIYHPPPLL